MRTRILEFRFGLVDLEGVIFNPGILVRREFGRFLHGRYNISAKEALRFFQAHEDLPLEAKFTRLFAQHGRSEEEGTEAADAFRETVATSRPVVSEGARELLETLSTREAQLFALSETASAIGVHKLEEAELRHHFGHVIGTDRAPRGLGQMEHCAEVIGLPMEAFASQSFILSSSPDDLTAAQEFGFYGIGVAHVFPESLLQGRGAQEAYRHVAHLSLLLRGA